jgi:hypothetical protein
LGPVLIALRMVSSAVGTVKSLSQNPYFMLKPLLQREQDPIVVQV